MGSIEKRHRTKRDGTSYHVWRARTRLRNGQARSKTFARKIDAEAWLTTMQAGRLDGTAADPKRGRTLYSTWLDRWQPTRKHGRRPSTVARDDSYLGNHVRPHWADWQLAAIERADVVDWIGGLSDKGLAPATVAKVYQLFAASIEDAVTDRYLGLSPCRDVELPKVRKRQMRFLTPAEIAKLADKMDVRYRSLVLVAAYGGLRIGELAGLHRGDVDLDRSQVKVQRAVSWVKGHLHVHEEPKTSAGRRSVGLPAFVVAKLTDHLDEHSGERIVFPAPEGGYIDPNRFRRRQFNPAAKAAGLDGLHPHALRHTAVSLWIAAGADVKRVAARAGHSSVAFTLDRYGHLYPDDETELMGALDKAARAASKADNVVPIRPKGA